MRQQSLLYIWLSIGYICALPYYYREDKHQAEHHHEYSYKGHDAGQVLESIPESQGIPHVSVPMIPEKYSSHVSPAQASSFSHGQGRGYSFSQESTQHGSSYQSSIPVSSQQYVHSTHYTSPVVVQRKVVKFYSYPTGTTQTDHVHMIGSGREIPVIVSQKEERFYNSGSHISGGQKEPDLENMKGVHSFLTKELNFGQESEQREVPEKSYRGTTEIGQQEDSIQNPIKLTYLPGVSTQKVERHYEIRRVGNLGTYDQKEGNQLDLGQTPSLNVLQNSQQEKIITSSQHVYHKAESGGLQSGQKEEDYFGQKEEDSYDQKEDDSFGQKEEDSFGQKEEDSFGQKEEDSFGQKEEDSFGQAEEKESLLHTKETKYKEEPLKVINTVLNGMHQKPYKKYESQSLEFGQKEESLSEQEPINLGQQEENGQTEEKESPFHSKYSSLQFGQKEEPLQGFNTFSPLRGQGSHYQSHASQMLVIGQKETGQEPLKLGQKEESLLGQQEDKENLHNSKYSSLEIGKKEEPVHGFTIVSQHRQSSLYPSHDNKNSEHEPLASGQGSLYQKQESQSFVIGQKEQVTGQEPIILSQKEEAPIGQEKEKESLYNSKYTSQEVGQKQELVHGYSTVSQHIQSESLYPSHGYENSEHKRTISEHGKLFPNHESQSFAIGQEEEPLTGPEPVVLSQKEESLIGQKEENFGQTEDTESLDSTKYSQLEMGQKEEPLQDLKVISQHIPHHSFHQNQGNEEPVKPITVQESATSGQKEILDGKGKYSTLVIGQHTVPIYINPHKYSYKEERSQTRVVDGSLGLGQKEPTLAKTDSIGLGQKEESESLYHVSKELGGQQKLFAEPIYSGRHEKIIHQHDEIKQLETGQREEPIREVKPNFLEQREQDEKLFSLGMHRGDTEFDMKEEKDPESLEHQPHGHRHHYHREETHRYHNGRSWPHSKSCTHGEHYQHGGFGMGQKAHDLEISSGRVKENENGNTGGQGLLYTSSHKESNHRVQEIHTSTSENSNRQFPSESPITKITSDANKPFGSNLDLDKMVEDLAKTIEGYDITTNLKPIVNTQAPKERITTSTPSVHLAEIEELGLENIKSQSSLQSRVITSSPEQKVHISETHKEEIGLDYPTPRKTYSKKHSRHYSVRQESHSSLPENTEQAPHVLTQAHSGRWHGYSQYGSSASHYGSSAAFLDDKYFPNERVKREASPEPDRKAEIDSFLSELDKEIARENRKPGQSSYVQVSSSQQQSQSQPGTSLYPTSSGSGETSWFKKVGDGISSTYNKAKGSISDTLNQAKEKISDTISEAKNKAKEMFTI